MPKKYVVSLFFLLLGLISIHFLKNETREMEAKIEKLSKNISYLKQDLEDEKLEFYYLSNPQRVSELTQEYLPKDYISLFPNQLTINEKK
jgi:cell division protein FtsL